MYIIIVRRFLEPSNDENLPRKILLLTIGNFYERSIDHDNMYYWGFNLYGPTLFSRNHKNLKNKYENSCVDSMSMNRSNTIISLFF